MLATTVIVAEYAGTLDVSDRSEVRARTTRQTRNPQGVTTPLPDTILGFDFSTAPRAAFVLADRRWRYSLTYAPTFVLPDLQSPIIVPQFINAGSAAIVWHDRL